jgi:hypothetical protein
VGYRAHSPDAERVKITKWRIITIGLMIRDEISSCKPKLISGSVGTHFSALLGARNPSHAQRDPCEEAPRWSLFCDDHWDIIKFQRTKQSYYLFQFEYQYQLRSSEKLGCTLSTGIRCRTCTLRLMCHMAKMKISYSPKWPKSGTGWLMEWCSKFRHDFKNARSANDNLTRS